MRQIDLEAMAIRRTETEMVLKVSCGTGDRLFFNGFQSWTTSHEVSPTDILDYIGPVLHAAGRPWGTARYGDEYFIKYMGKPGFFHGFTYMYLRRGDKYQLIASTDESNGYTIFYYDVLKRELYIDKDAGFTDKYDKDLHVVCFEGTEDEVFDAWFAASGIKCRDAKPLAGYSSWYNRYAKITDETITEDLEGCSKVLKPGDLFQIDDGWEPAVGDWLEEDRAKFPGGLKKLVDEIHDSGFQAGIWLAPFVAETESRVFKEHPDWFFRHEGEMFCCGCNWSDFYSLDIDNPEVQDYLRRVFDKVFNTWGFDLVKLDFLYGAAPYGTANETRAGRMIRAMKFLRELCGDHPILGCGVPVMPAFGLVEYCRISCDVSLDWNDKLHMRVIHRERPSTRNAIANSISRRSLNRRAYLSDPDVFFLRTENCGLSEKQKHMLASVNALLGGVFLTSDDPSAYTEEMKEKYRQYRHLSEAETLAVHTDNGLSITYLLAGQKHTIHF